MSAPDDDFDDFLRRRKPLFDRSRDDDLLEPPAELDRVVLRQAREAIEPPRPQRLYRAPRWSAPLAVAATLAVAFTVVLQLMPKHRATPQATADISMQPASRPVDASPEASAPAKRDVADAPFENAARRDGTVIVQLDPGAAEPVVTREARMQRRAAAGDAATAASAPAAAPAPDAFVSQAEADRYAEPPPPPVLAKRRSDPGVRGEISASTANARRAEMSGAPVVVAQVPEYRRDEKTWLAEIKRLQDAGETERAEAERAEYKRLHRAYAVGPDR
jgi:hypothetical protein